jgi:hypothetical protein
MSEGSGQGWHPTVVGSAIRALTLAGASLTTGLIASVFYAYAVSVIFGLAGSRARRAYVS